MKTRRTIFGVVVVLLLLLPAAAKAGVIYTLYFPGYPGFGPADSFSFTVESFLTSTGIAGIPTPGGELNGLTFESIRTESWGSGRRDFSFSLAETPSLPSGFIGFHMAVEPSPIAPGTYQSPHFATSYAFWNREGPSLTVINVSPGGFITVEGTGTAVPDPGSTLLLLSIGIVSLRAWRKRRQ